MRYCFVLILLFALVCGFASAQAFTASPSQVNKTVAVGQTGVPSQDIVITNSGPPATVSAVLSPAVSWASVQVVAQGGTLPSGASTLALRLNFATQGLPAGSYSTTILATFPGRPDLEIPVTVQVAAPTLTVQPQEVTFTGAPGSAASNPPLLPITVSNIGTGTNYFITPSPSAPWIKVNKTSGFVAANESDTFEIRTDATNLTSTGDVVGTVEITAVGRPSRIVTVRLQLSGAQDITVSPGTLTFAGQAGATTSAPSLATVTVANGGAATGYNINVDQPWLVVSKTSGTLAQNGTDTFTVTASPQFQTVGTKSGSITISAAGRAPRSVPSTPQRSRFPPRRAWPHRFRPVPPSPLETSDPRWATPSPQINPGSF